VHRLLQSSANNFIKFVNHLASVNLINLSIDIETQIILNKQNVFDVLQAFYLIESMNS